MSSYQPLARKYRPHSFADLLGQDIVTKSLTNAISMNREPHAVLFTGVRGVGKTTSARIYAKALNCASGPTVNPCNQCESCLAISDGIHEDVTEIDGASNTSVEDIRQLRETVVYVPQRSKFKIYIIDEVHMLSISAFNALLKTLEEPPAHVVFMFATTEVQKIPETILSRCQVFYLRKISTRLIEKNLRDILTKENIVFEDGALKIIAREARGSMRDGLSLLDQAMIFSGGKITIQSLSTLTPAASSAQLITLLGHLIAKDSVSILNVIRKCEESGFDMIDVVEQLAMFARFGFLLRDLPKGSLEETWLDLSEEEKNLLQTISDNSDAFDLNRVFRTLMKCRKDLDGSELDRYLVENYMMEWCLDPGIPKWDQTSAAPSPTTKEPVIQKGESLKEALQRQLQKPEPQPTKTPEPKPPVQAHAQQTPPQPQVPQEAPKTEAVASSTFPKSWAECVETWKRVKPLQARKLEEVYPLEFSPQRIILGVDEKGFASQTLLQKEEQTKLRAAFKEVFGFEGVLNIEKHAAKRAEAPETSPQQHTETLLAERERRESEHRQNLEKSVREHPLTQFLVNEKGAKIERIDMIDQPSV